MDSYETKAEAARVMAQISSEMALDMKSRMPRVPTGPVSFLSPPPVHRAGIPVLAPKPKRSAAEVAAAAELKAYQKAVKEAAKADEKAAKEAEKAAVAEGKARMKASKEAEKAFTAYQKEQAKIAKEFEKAMAPPKKAAAPKAPKAPKAPTKAALESEVMRLRALLASRGLPY